MFWQRWVFDAVCALSLAVVLGLIVVASLIAEHGPEGMGLSSYDSQALEQTQQWWRTGLVAPRHVGSSRPRN